MMSTAPPLRLTREEASRLQAYLQTYRRYAFASLFPSAERNTTLRMLQAMQGRLIEAMNQRATQLQLVLTTGEMTTLKTITMELLVLYAKEPASAGRNRIIADLATLKASLKGY